MKYKTTVTVSNPERKAQWESIFGSATVPVISIIPEMANLPGFYEPQRVFKLDLSIITNEHRAKLVAFIAGKFNIPVEVVSDQLEDHGVPILAEDCGWSTSDPGVFFSLID